MRLYVKITVVFTLILLIMHYRKYNNFSDGYEIQQQELDYKINKWKKGEK